jgi:short-subunit dehydrogenase
MATAAMGTHPRTAIVVGASSGIGEAIAARLAAEGWRVGLAARRLSALEALAQKLGQGAVAAAVDLADPDGARAALQAFAAQLGDVELWVLNAGTGEANPEFEWAPERDTLQVNVMGFAAMADVAMHHCLARGRGRIVGVSSIARFQRRPGAIAYSASKAYVSTCLDGLRTLARARKLPITVTEACPGFVDTPMMKAPNPFWVATPEKAARQILAAAERGRSIVYVSRRWALIAALLSFVPR